METSFMTELNAVVTGKRGDYLINGPGTTCYLYGIK